MKLSVVEKPQTNPTSNTVQRQTSWADSGGDADTTAIVYVLALRLSGNLPVSFVLTGNLPEIYHIMYFLVISNYLGGNNGTKPYN